MTVLFLSVVRKLPLFLVSVFPALALAYIPHPLVKGAVDFSAILSVARVPREAAWRYL